jgi:YD repeat-containing protein
VNFTYDQVGRLSSLMRTTNGNYTTTINTGYTLDLLDRVTSITHSKGMGEDASTLSQFTYGYDANGRVTNYTGSEGSLSFALDANGQLLSVTGSRADNYSFDATGNTTSYGYDHAERLVEEIDPRGTPPITNMMPPKITKAKANLFQIPLRVIDSDHPLVRLS